jgi:hypothetical protein
MVVEEFHVPSLAWECGLVPRPSASKQSFSAMLVSSVYSDGLYGLPTKLKG